MHLVKKNEREIAVIVDKLQCIVLRDLEEKKVFILFRRIECS